MKIRRDLIIMGLAIFCLTATLFMIRPTNSDTGTTNPYNPWADVNNDGTVNILDAIGLSSSFGSIDTGVNSRNVTVRDGSVTWSSGTITLLHYDSWWSSIINSSYYTQITLRIKTNGSLNIWLHTFVEDSDVKEYVNNSLYYSDPWYTVTYKIKSTTLQVEFQKLGSYDNPAISELCVYMSAIPVVDFPNVQNVTVTNWPQSYNSYSIQTGTMRFNSSVGGLIPTIFCGGYSRISILLGSNGANLGNGSVTISLEYFDWTQDSSMNSPAVSTESLTHAFNITIFDSGGFGWPTSCVTETYAPYCHLVFFVNGAVNVPADWWANVNYAVYLRNE